MPLYCKFIKLPFSGGSIVCSTNFSILSLEFSLFCKRCQKKQTPERKLETTINNNNDDEMEIVSIRKCVFVCGYFTVLGNRKLRKNEVLLSLWDLELGRLKSD
jgi:hypothetical protein